MSNEPIQIGGIQNSTHKMLAAKCDADHSGTIEGDELSIFTKLKRTFDGLSPEERNKQENMSTRINSFSSKVDKKTGIQPRGYARNVDSLAWGGNNDGRISGKEMKLLKASLFPDTATLDGVKLILNDVKSIRKSDTDDYDYTIEYTSGDEVHFSKQNKKKKAKLAALTTSPRWDTVINARGFEANNSGKSIGIIIKDKNQSQVILSDTHINYISKDENSGVRAFLENAKGTPKEEINVNMIDITDSKNLAITGEGTVVRIAEKGKRNIRVYKEKSSLKRNKPIETKISSNITLNGQSVVKNEKDEMLNEFLKKVSEARHKNKSTESANDYIRKLLKLKVITKDEYNEWKCLAGI